jgi:hypothetical protein
VSLEHSPAREHERAACYTIIEFCESHRTSRSKLYQLWQMGLGPRVQQIGPKKLITDEATANAERSVRP